MATTTSTLTVRFKACGKSAAHDEVTLNLANGQIVGAPVEAERAAADEGTGGR
jgi:hypothetical protein